VYFRHAAQKTHLVSGNENLCSTAGVEPTMRLVDAAGLDRLAAATSAPAARRRRARR
jgi:hypothetical protein